MAKSSSPTSGASKPLFAQRVGLLVFFSLAAFLTRDFLAPVMVGAIFAVVFYPTFCRVKGIFREGPRRVRLAATLTTLIFGLSVLLPVGGMIFAGADAGVDQIEAFKRTSDENGGAAAGAQRWIESRQIVEKLAQWLPMEEEQLKESLQAGLGAVAAAAGGLLQAILSQIPYVLISGLVVLLAVYYFLIDGSKSVAFIEARSPFPKRQTSMVLKSVHSSCHSAIMASLVTGLIQSLLMTLGALIFGVPNVVLIGLISFVLSLIPLIGTAPVTLVIVAGFLVGGETGRALGFMGVGVFIGITDNFVRPYLVRSGTQIHPLSAFVFTFGAVTTIGFYGLFIGPVAAGILSGMMRSWRETRA